jgi:two-component system response regulator HydG
MTNLRLLVAEDDAAMRELLQEVLEESGYEVVAANDGRAALSHIERDGEHLDLVLTDVHLPGVKGDELLNAVRARRGETPVIVITAFGSVEQAVEMVKAGAFQYLTKPFATNELLAAVKAALESTAAQREQARLRRENPETPARLIGASRQMRELFDLIARAGRNMSPVLITGESGTGKELVARAIHEASRRKGALVAVNCAAIPADLVEAELFGHTGQAFTGARQARPGLFEAADGGTIFLDEIGELPLSAQPKLLRVMQEGTVRRVGADTEKTVNLRVVAATNRDLEKETQAGNFREDLYWRLNVIHLHTPALRERPFDIPLLVEHFLEKIARQNDAPQLEVSGETLAVLTAYAWPGNVRELENALERAAAFARGAALTPADLPERICAQATTSGLLARAEANKLTMAELEREYILATLRQNNGNKSRAAEVLGLDRKTLYRKLDEYRAADSSLAL